jgi:hypothetical protein
MWWCVSFCCDEELALSGNLNSAVVWYRTVSSIPNLGRPLCDSDFKISCSVRFTTDSTLPQSGIDCIGGWCSADFINHDVDNTNSEVLHTT